MQPAVARQVAAAPDVGPGQLAEGRFGRGRHERRQVAHVGCAVPGVAHELGVLRVGDRVHRDMEAIEADRTDWLFVLFAVGGAHQEVTSGNVDEPGEEFFAH